MNDKGISPEKHIAVMGIKGLPAKGGGERVAEAIINKALEKGFKLTVYGKRNYFENFDASNRFQLVKIRDIKGKHLSPFSFGILSAFHALLFGRYDLIHLHYADFGFIVPLLRLRFKVISTSHGAEYNRDKWGKFAKLCFKLFEIFFVRYSNVCTSVSKFLAEYYRKRYRKAVFFIPNGVFLDGQTPNGKETCKKYNLHPKEYILFCAGRIIPSKGCDILLKANRKLHQRNPLVIIGDADSDPKYKDYLQTLAEPNVLFIGFIKSKKELFEIILNCKFFVFPSTYEAMSMMLLEAGVLKKGIICSYIAENVETIGDNAIYFESGNSDSLAEKMDFAINNAAYLDALGRKAANWISEHRNWESITERYMQIYRSI